MTRQNARGKGRFFLIFFLSGLSKTVRNGSPASSMEAEPRQMLYQIFVTFTLLGSCIVMHRRLILFTLLVLPFGKSFAQAFDPNCYFPKIGAEVDTLTGRPFFGYDLIKLDSDPKTGDEKFACIVRDVPDQQVVFSSGKITDIHNLSIRSQWNVNLGNAIFGHFRSRIQKDAFHGETNRIYWVDDEGNFDSSRFTQLRSSIQGNYSPETGHGFQYYRMDPIVAKLSNDTLDDIILMGNTRWSTLQETNDSTRIFILLFKGGSLQLPFGEIAYSDSCIEYGISYEDTVVEIINGDTIGRYIPVSRNIAPGDFRGTGRIDIITVDYYGNFFFFKNDLPFSMEKFMRGIRYDTLSVVRDNPNWVQSQKYYRLSWRGLQVFPKFDWDKSEDFIGRFNTNDYRSQAWLFFRGGPDFGSKRITLDSAEFILRSPSQLGAFGSYFGGAYYMDDCGDMTGTGNRVIKTVGGVGHAGGEDLYYVVGKALDDRIDINVSYDNDPSSPVIKVKADTDSLQDVLFQINNYRYPSLDPISGSLGVLRGTSKIPVTLNPKYAVEERKALSATGNSLLAAPNPFVQKTILTFDNCSSGKMYMEVVNTLGKIMLREEIVDVDGVQQYSANLSMLVPGAYHIRLVCPADGWSATATVVKVGQ